MNEQPTKVGGTPKIKAHVLLSVLTVFNPAGPRRVITLFEEPTFFNHL